jgi:hypothetical protein
LVPKKANEFKKETAKDLDLPENLVSDFIDFYWDRVRTNMTQLNYESIYIPNLGTFKVKHWKIDETIENHKATIGRVGGLFSAYKIKLDLTDKIEKLEKIKQVVEKREIKFKKIKDARKNKDNMEEPGSDMGRLQEPDIQE